MPEIIIEGFGQERRRFLRWTPDELRAVFRVDHDSGLLLLQDGTVPAMSSHPDGYLQVLLHRLGGLRQQRELVHRIIFAMVNDWWPEIVDHINRDRLDNRPANLQASIPRLNNLNRKGRIGSTFGWTGRHYSVGVCTLNGAIFGKADTKADARLLEADLRRQAGLDLLADLIADDKRKLEIQRAQAVAAIGVDPVLVGFDKGLIVPPAPKWIVPDEKLTGPRKWIKPAKVLR